MEVNKFRFKTITKESKRNKNLTNEKFNNYKEGRIKYSMLENILYLPKNSSTDTLLITVGEKRTIIRNIL